MKSHATALLLFTVFVFGVQENAVSSGSVSSEPASASPIGIIDGYLRALHARDSRTAYRFISAHDRSVRDAKTYAGSQQTFHGFALELARWFAAEMKISVVDEKVRLNRTRLEITYRVPAGDEIASRLLDWNPEKLNGLSAVERQQLIVTLDELKKSGKMVMIEGREAFNLIHETNGWRVFLDWPARPQVTFKTSDSVASTLEVHFPRNNLLVMTNEPFQIEFTVKNRGPKPMVVRLNHIIEPRRLTTRVHLISCGLMSPFTLQPDEMREFSSSYILGEEISPKTQVKIIYDLVAKTGAAPER